MITIKKIIISFILIFILLFSSITFASSLFFTDVLEDFWYYDSVKFVSEKGWMQGYDNLFRPDDYVTRSEIATIIERLYQSINGSEQQKIDTIIKVMPYCVSINCGAGFGSGVVIKDNLILTANHVIKENDVNIMFYNNDAVSGRVLYRSEKDDLAIVQIVSSDYDFESLKIVEEAQVGESIIVIGNPMGNRFTTTVGVLSNLSRFYKNYAYLQFDADVSPGSSGSPIFNLRGELLGIVVKKVMDKNADGISYATPYYRIKEFINEKLK